MSKFMYFDFRCLTCEHRFEDFVKPDVNPPCPECQSATDRLISTPRIELGGMDADFPSAYDKWEKTNKQKTAIDRKFFKEHGEDKKHHSYGS
jgi:putative FmdB family regulatory protein